MGPEEMNAWFAMRRCVDGSLEFIRPWNGKTSWVYRGGRLVRATTFRVDWTCMWLPIDGDSRSQFRPRRVTAPSVRKPSIGWMNTTARREWRRARIDATGENA